MRTLRSIWSDLQSMARESSNPNLWLFAAVGSCLLLAAIALTWGVHQYNQP
jgi:hypothetical protein